MNPESEFESEEFEDLMLQSSDPGSPSMSMEDQVAHLTALVTRLAARIDAGDAVPPPMDPPVTVPPQGPFILPATVQLSASPSLCSLFPEIEEAHITAIITHEFPRADHWKLDSRYRDKEPAFAFNSTAGQFESFNSVQLSLHTARHLVQCPLRPHSPHSSPTRRPLCLLPFPPENHG